MRLLATGVTRAVAWRLCLAAALSVAGGALAALAPLALKGLFDSLGKLNTLAQLGGINGVDGASAVSAASAVSGVSGGNGLTGANAATAATGWLLTIGAPVAAYVAAHSLARLVSEIRPVVTSAAEQRLQTHLRQRFFDRVLSLPTQFHLTRRTGALLQELQQAAAGYQIILFHLVNSVLPVLVETGAIMAILTTFDQPALTAIIASTALAYLAVMTRRTTPLRAAATAVNEASVDVHARLAEGLGNVEPIKMFGAERASMARLGAASLSLERAWRLLHRLRLLQGAATVLVFAASMGAFLLLAANAVLDGSLTLGGFVLANVYMLQVIRPLEALSGAVRDICQGLAFVRPLVGILCTPVDLARAHHPLDRAAAGPAHDAAARTSPPSPALSPAPSTPSTPSTPLPSFTRQAPPHIAFRGVGLTYEDRAPVLRGVDLDIAAGRSLAIVGPTGSGKSSLVRLLLRLQEPQEGKILMDGLAIAEMPIDHLRGLVAVVPQDVMLFHATIAANIALGRDHATRREINRASRLAGLGELLDALPDGLQTVIGERGLKLSGGERQRVAIARAILRDPLVYVFDEATSMLDTATEAKILRDLRNVAAGCTTITVAHRLSTIQHADHIAVLAQGRVVEQGNHAALLQHGGAYAALWRSQAPQ
ncbi:ATP-binding cassette domain-containing protein [Roseateles chitinivorans]|uniref:ATP-binding cassette domain-containing protein n=1 Tax=Roseateles chitinivorans TaxID=2917965 RepID=UPI003D664A6B